MASIDALQKDAEKSKFAGVAAVDDHKRYTKAVASTQETGFMEFKVRDPVTQAKYDATSPSWEGVASSDSAIARGDYSLDSAESTRDSLRKKPQPVYVPPTAPTSYCVVQ
jgi:predicted lipoprotein with Yx(FWY)xxD motif